MANVHVIGYAQLDKNERRLLSSPDDYSALARDAEKDGNDFFQVGMRYLDSRDSRVLLNSAVLVNLVFACELFLKSLIYRAGKASPREHNLMRLYKKLSKAEQDEIYSKCLQFLRRPERSEFDLCLKEIGDAFNVLRYKYEYRGMVIEARFILGFTFALKEKMEQQSN